MMAELHDFGARGMTVMDGRRCVAKGRKVHGGWLLTLRGMSWSDTMRNERQKAWFDKLGLRCNASPWLKLVKDKSEAREHLNAIAAQFKKIAQEPRNDRT